MLKDGPPPLAYGDAAEEYRAARGGVGLVDRRDHGVVEVTGRDRAAFLHALLSNDVKALAPGQACAATLLDVHGRVQAVLLVWALDDRIRLVTPPGMAQKILEALDHYLFSEKAELRDASEETALFLLAGPEARAVAGRLAAGAARVVGGVGETGLPEVWIAAAASDGARVWDALVAAGACPLGLTASESLRIEAGTPRFGQDVDPSVLLPEIPLVTLVSYTKGCYPGQEVVVRIRDRGHVNRLLRGLVLEGEAVPSPGDGVLAAGAEVGKVTSAARSFGLRRPIALAFVKRAHADPGAAVTVRTGGREVAARVSDLPFAR